MIDVSQNVLAVPCFCSCIGSMRTNRVWFGLVPPPVFFLLSRPQRPRNEFRRKCVNTLLYIRFAKPCTRVFRTVRKPPGRRGVPCVGKQNLSQADRPSCGLRSLLHHKGPRRSFSCYIHTRRGRSRQLWVCPKKSATNSSSSHWKTCHRALARTPDTRARVNSTTSSRSWRTCPLLLRQA